ncbi:hypothetical protein BSKO_00819 [Bryopsis sp. KO-2023]|nr:hypothetical protein BSKO_00819 [Bryopsis sp. KO-2023]
MKRTEREGGSGSGEKKQAKKGRRQPNSRPPWCLPELDDKAGKRNGSQTNPPKKQEKPTEPTAKPIPKPTPEPIPEGSSAPTLAKAESNGRAAAESSRKPTGKDVPAKEAKSFKVVEHLDLMSNSSSEDMDLDSDHEGRPVHSRQRVDMSPSGPAERTQTARRDEGGVTLGDGGPGTQLHWELVEYEKRSRLTEKQTVRRQEVIRIVTDAALKTCPQCEVMCFGSSANGLGTPTSDLDLVMIGVFEPNSEHGGYTDPIKGEVSNLLDHVMRELRHTLDIKTGFIIRRARIPLIKLTTMDDLDVDLSICDEHGPKAAKFMREKVAKFPPLRPLCLALKSLIKDKGMNEVVSGGLGTYALSNMIIAHLMDLQKKGDYEMDMGSLFVSFLKRFGCTFDYIDHAVSIRRGGIVDKEVVVGAGVVIASNYQLPPHSRPHQRSNTPTHERLLVEDYFTGRDVSSGTFKISQISRLFASVYVNLKERFCVPPLPPDGPELSTLSTLFKINGFEKRESLPRIDTFSGGGGGGKRKFEETDSKREHHSAQGRKKKKSKNREQAETYERKSTAGPAPLKETDRDAFVARIKSILKQKF